jgi:hypothetical protein
MGSRITETRIRQDRAVAMSDGIGEIINEVSAAAGKSAHTLNDMNVEPL